MTREQLREFKKIYQQRIKHYRETICEDNHVFNLSMIDMNRNCLEIVNEALGETDDFNMPQL